VVPTADAPVLGAMRDMVSGLIIAAIIAMVVLLGALLWVLHRGEQEELQEALIKDILWVEQTLQFHLTTDEEKLQQIAQTLGRRPDNLVAAESQLQQVMAGNPELERLVWRNLDGRVLVALPPVAGNGEEAGGPEPVPEPNDYAYVAGTGRSLYGMARKRPEGTVIPLHVPVFDDRGLRGILTATISFNTLLSHQVPWWVAENYQLTIADADGAVLASRSHVAAQIDGPSHAIPFDPPGHGLVLSAIGYRSQTHLTRNLIVAVILCLACAVVGSLIALQRQARRRHVFELALRNETAFRRAMEESAIVGLRARTLDGRVLYVNRAFCDMVGYGAEEIVGRKPPMPYWMPEEAEATMQMHRAVIAGQAPAQGYELRWRRRDGKIIDVLTYEAPLIDADGRQAGWMGSVLDITDRKRAEDQASLQQEKLQQTARLIAMGEMASTLAHELSQPLAAIASYAAGCLNHATAGDISGDAMVVALDKLGQQAQRAGGIIRRVHDFVRKSDPVLQPCGVATILRDSVEFITADARKRGIGIRLDLPNEDVSVIADRILIEQVLLNLMRNGIEAMEQTKPSNGILAVSLRNDCGQVVVSVSDLGPGIPAGLADRLYAPFFTTKSAGMGMGLNICRTILELHHGRLWHEVNPGGGSIFSFTLPREAELVSGS